MRTKDNKVWHTVEKDERGKSRDVWYVEGDQRFKKVNGKRILYRGGELHEGLSGQETRIENPFPPIGRITVVDTPSSVEKQ